MKALKDCKWVVDIYDDGWGFVEIDDHEFKWEAKSQTCAIYSAKDYKTYDGCLNNWKKFAELNGIKNYVIRGTGT